MSKNFPPGVVLRPGGGGERKPGAARRVTNGSVRGGERPLTALVNRKRNSLTSFSQKTAAERSGSNILSEIQCSNYKLVKLASVNKLIVGSASKIARPLTHSALDFFEKPGVMINYEGAYDLKFFHTWVAVDLNWIFLLLQKQKT